MNHKTTTCALLIALLTPLLTACQRNSSDDGRATFAYFTYEGNDPRFEGPFDSATQYLNPILAGFYPDPSICRKGDTYYLVCSSFAFFPGVPLFSSTDLVSWRQGPFVLSRPGQLPLDGQGVSAGIFAPAISYNPLNDTFYMITTNVGAGNFFVTTHDPLTEPWSDPIYLPQVDGIDPSFFFDDDGRAYIVHNAPTMDPEDYSGQRAIRILPFDTAGDSICGPAVEIVRGGTHVEERPIWIEGPHLFKTQGTYYLMCAEGGTGDHHSEVIFRSQSPYGPWEEAPNNPILTQRDLTGPRGDNIVTSAGHADLVQTPSGDWWAVFLGCRPYEDDYYNTGRDTYLLPVSWNESGWPTILPPGTPIPTVVDAPHTLTRDGDPYLTGNFTYTDRFAGDTLHPRWLALRRPAQDCVTLTDKGLALTPLATALHDAPGRAAESCPPASGALAAIFTRQQHTHFAAETSLTFAPEDSLQFAGLALLQNEQYHFTFGKTLVDGQSTVILTRANRGAPETIASQTLSAPDQGLRLRIEGHGRYYDFLYAEGEGDWQTLAEHVDAVLLSTHASGGFIGTMIGLYATSPQSAEP